MSRPRGRRADRRRVVNHKHNWQEPVLEAAMLVEHGHQHADENVPRPDQHTRRELLDQFWAALGGRNS
jgi:hypothetical protein